MYNETSAKFNRMAAVIGENSDAKNCGILRHLTAIFICVHITTVPYCFHIICCFFIFYVTRMHCERKGWGADSE
jgi:hypothetical protein